MTRRRYAAKQATLRKSCHLPVRYGAIDYDEPERDEEEVRREANPLCERPCHDSWSDDGKLHLIHRKEEPRDGRRF